MADILSSSNRILSRKASGVYSGVSIQKVQWDATCGDTTLSTEYTSEIIGELARIVFIPNSVAGVWNAAIYDEDGVNLIEGEGADLSNTVPTQLVGATLPAIASPIRLYCSGLVAGDEITVKVFVK